MYYEFGKFRLRLDRQTLTKNRKELNVEPQVFSIISYFVTNPNRVISKDELIKEIWNGRIVSESSISTRINQARKVLGDTGQKQNFIKTVHNKGFRFIADLKIIEDNAVILEENEKPILTISRPVTQTQTDPAPRFTARSALYGLGLFALGVGSTLTFQNLSSQKPLNPNIDITKFTQGDEIIGVHGRDTLDLSKRKDTGFMVGLPAGVINPREDPQGRSIFSLKGIYHIIGSPQDDWLRGTFESNVFHGGDGDDWLQGYDGVDRLYGENGDDILNGGYFVDEIFGGPGNDTIIVATDSPGDNADGGEGVDTLDLHRFTYSGYHVDLSAGRSWERKDREMGTFKLANIENIIGTPQDDILRGDHADNEITGFGGANEIDGSSGIDTALYTLERAAYQMKRASDGSIHIAQILTPEEYDILRSIEILRFKDSQISTELIK